MWDKVELRMLLNGFTYQDEIVNFANVTHIRKMDLGIRVYLNSDNFIEIDEESGKIVILYFIAYLNKSND